MTTHGHGPLVPGPDCASYAHLLPLLGTGTLDPAEERAVRRHAAGCAWCRAQLADYARVDAAMRRHVGSLMMDAPRQTMGDIMRLAEVPKRTKRRPPMRAATRGPRRLLPGLGALAAVLLLAALFGWIFARTAPERPKPVSTPLPTPTVNLSGVTLYAPTPLLSAFRGSDGSTLWTEHPSGQALIDSIQPAGIAHGMLYSVYTLGSTDGTSVKLAVTDLRTGTTTLDQTLDLPQMNSPYVAAVGDTLYMTSDWLGGGTVGAAHGVYALRASDGSVLWRHPTTEAVFSAPLVVDGVVYASLGTSLLALRASDGTTLWQVPLQANGKHAIAERLASDGKTLYVVADEQLLENPSSTTGENVVLSALRPSDGSLLWHFDLGGGSLGQLSSPLIVHGTVYVSAGASRDEETHGNTSSAHLYALRASDGKQLWQYHEDRTTLTSSAGEKTTIGAVLFNPVATDGFVYFNDMLGNVIALRGDNGSHLWTRKLGTEAVNGVAGLAVAGGAVFVAVNGEIHQGANGANATADPNQLVALRTGDGSTLWSRSFHDFLGGWPGVPSVGPLIVASSS